MEKVQQEVRRTDPDVPFRASTSHVHYVWAKTFASRPELYIQPQTLPEVQKVVNLARRCRRRIVVVGCGHSPSDITCTSSWIVNLDNYSKVLKVDKQKKTLLVQAGIRLHQLNLEAEKHDLTIPNLGSIDEQSIAGACATATHGSSLRHGLLSDNIKSLRIVLSNGSAVRCSADQNPDLFRAALVSLGALGIIIEVEYQMTDSGNIEWTQSLLPLDDILGRWGTTLWTQHEFTRVWWMPYMKRAIVWSASKTDKDLCPPEENFYGGSVGYHTYHNLLWLSNYIPWILPAVEWFVFGMQYGFSPGQSTTAVEPLRTGLLMNCLYSQFVNEWALPLSKGPEAITRLSDWINRTGDSGKIPFSAKGLYVHCPIEVRVSNTTIRSGPRPFLDNTCATEPTLYLNATLYRAHLRDPPCKDRYYEAFEWLMQDLGAKPHYAKNFTFTTPTYLQQAFGSDLTEWTRIRNEADPEGMFIGEWHRRTLGLGDAQVSDKSFALQEREVTRTAAKPGHCKLWSGALSSSAGGDDEKAVAGLNMGGDVIDQQPLTATPGARANSPSVASSSGESFDMLHGAEAEKSVLYDGDEEEGNGDDGDETDRDERRYHGNPTEGVTGTKVFDKM